MARSKSSMRAESVMAAWFRTTTGSARAPRRSADTSRSARPVTIAYRNTQPTIARTRRAVSWEQRASTRLRVASSSGALIFGDWGAAQIREQEVFQEAKIVLVRARRELRSEVPFTRARQPRSSQRSRASPLPLGTPDLNCRNTLTNTPL